MTGPICLVKGYRYETERGMGSRPKDLVVIHIPSKNLVVYDEGSAYKREAPISKKGQAVAERFFQNNSLTTDEKRVLIRHANKETSVKVKLPVDVVNELCEVLEKGLPVNSMYTGIDEAIASLVKQLFRCR